MITLSRNNYFRHLWSRTLQNSCSLNYSQIIVERFPVSPLESRAPIVIRIVPKSCCSIAIEISTRIPRLCVRISRAFNALKFSKVATNIQTRVEKVILIPSIFRLFAAGSGAIYSILSGYIRRGTVRQRKHFPKFISTSENYRRANRGRASRTETKFSPCKIDPLPPPLSSYITQPFLHPDGCLAGQKISHAYTKRRDIIAHRKYLDLIRARRAIDDGQISSRFPGVAIIHIGRLYQQRVKTLIKSRLRFPSQSGIQSLSDEIEGTILRLVAGDRDRIVQGKGDKEATVERRKEFYLDSQAWTGDGGKKREEDVIEW